MLSVMGTYQRMAWLSFKHAVETESNFKQDLSLRSRRFKSSLSHYKLSFDDKEGEKKLEITVERSAEYPQFVTEPEVAFKTFLAQMKGFSC